MILNLVCIYWLFLVLFLKIFYLEKYCSNNILSYSKYSFCFDVYVIWVNLLKICIFYLMV